MFRLAVGFLVLAVMAGLFGFGGFTNHSWDGLKLLALVFLILAMVSFVADLIRKPST